jgi:hypothetical protein
LFCACPGSPYVQLYFLLFSNQRSFKIQGLRGNEDTEEPILKVTGVSSGRILHYYVNKNKNKNKKNFTLLCSLKGPCGAFLGTWAGPTGGLPALRAGGGRRQSLGTVNQGRSAETAKRQSQHSDLISTQINTEILINGHQDQKENIFKR